MALRLKLKRLLNPRNSPLKQNEILSFLTKYQALVFSRPLHLLLRLGTSVFSTLLKPSRHSLVLIPRSISLVNSMGIETRSLNEVHGLVEEFSLQSPWPPLEEREMVRRSTLFSEISTLLNASARRKRWLSWPSCTNFSTTSLLFFVTKSPLNLGNLKIINLGETLSFNLQRPEAPIIC